MIYYTSGTSKRGYGAWESGEKIFLLLHTGSLIRRNVLVDALISLPSVCKLLTRFTVHAETHAFMYLFAPFPRLRVIFISAMICLHVGIATTMCLAGFNAAMIATLFLIMPPMFYDVVERLGSSSTATMRNARSDICRAIDKGSYVARGCIVVARVLAQICLATCALLYTYDACSSMCLGANDVMSRPVCLVWRQFPRVRRYSHVLADTIALMKGGNQVHVPYGGEGAEWRTFNHVVGLVRTISTDAERRDRVDVVNLFREDNGVDFWNLETWTPLRHEFLGSKPSFLVSHSKYDRFPQDAFLRYVCNRFHDYHDGDSAHLLEVGVLMSKAMVTLSNDGEATIERPQYDWKAHVVCEKVMMSVPPAMSRSTLETSIVFQALVHIAAYRAHAEDDRSLPRALIVVNRCRTSLEIALRLTNEHSVSKNISRGVVQPQSSWANICGPHDHYVARSVRTTLAASPVSAEDDVDTFSFMIVYQNVTVYEMIEREGACVVLEPRLPR